MLGKLLLVSINFSYKNDVYLNYLRNLLQCTLIVARATLHQLICLLSKTRSYFFLVSIVPYQVICINYNVFTFKIDNMKFIQIKFYYKFLWNFLYDLYNSYIHFCLGEIIWFNSILIFFCAKINFCLL